MHFKVWQTGNKKPFLFLEKCFFFHLINKLFIKSQSNNWQCEARPRQNARDNDFSASSSNIFSFLCSSIRGRGVGRGGGGERQSFCLGSLSKLACSDMHVPHFVKYLRGLFKSRIHVVLNDKIILGNISGLFCLPSLGR